MLVAKFWSILTKINEYYVQKDMLQATRMGSRKCFYRIGGEDCRRMSKGPPR